MISLPHILPVAEADFGAALRVADPDSWMWPVAGAIVGVFVLVLFFVIVIRIRRQKLKQAAPRVPSDAEKAAMAAETRAMKPWLWALMGGVLLLVGAALGLFVLYMNEALTAGRTVALVVALFVAGAMIRYTIMRLDKARTISRGR